LAFRKISERVTLIFLWILKVSEKSQVEIDWVMRGSG